MNRVDTDEESVYVFNNDSRKPLTERSDNLNPFLEDEVPNSIKTSNPDPVVDPNISRFMLYTRLINIGLSVCMITASLISAVGSNTITAGVLGCYVAVFACLLCCFETHIKQVSKLIASNFGFMYSAKSRAVFMVFVGTLMFSFNLVGQLVGALMIANAGFNIFVIIKYPDYDEVQKKDAQAEISEFLQSNPAFAKQVVAAGVKATSDFVSKNPDLARQGAEAYISAQRKQTIN